LIASEKKSVRRLFYEMQGCSMSSYILRCRAFRAFAELLNTNHSLAEIAHRCGFYDQRILRKFLQCCSASHPGDCGQE
jgi:AraC-like DNA-binding protein